MANHVFVYIDHSAGTAPPSSWEALGVGRTVAGTLGGGVTALVFGHQVEALAQQAFEHGADEVLLADDAGLKDYRAEAYAGALAGALAEAGARVLLLPTTSRTRELAGMVAVDLETGVIPDAVAIEVVDGAVVPTRPIYGGKLLSKVKTAPGKLQIISVRSRAFPLPEPEAGRSGTLTRLTPEVKSLTEVVEYKPSDGGVSLNDAAVIVSGGRGVASNPRLTPPAELKDEKEIEIWRAQQGFTLVRELAAVLRAAVGASRAAVDAGYVPYANQVGQTGKVVSPDVYVACGISGAIQHLAGMRTSKTIVAINKDAEAPIFKVARFGVVGDMHEVVPALTAALKAKLGR